MDSTDAMISYGALGSGSREPRRPSPLFPQEADDSIIDADGPRTAHPSSGVTRNSFTLKKVVGLRLLTAWCSIQPSLSNTSGT